MSTATGTAEVTIRTGRRDDADACGRICYQAFATLAERHGFPPDFPSPEVATGVVGALLVHPGFHAVVAEQDGRIVGSNFLDERGPIAGVGPITVDAACQDAGIGRRLMLAVLERARERDFAGVRLLQAAYHNRSLGLYSTLGFQVREPVLNLDGAPLGERLPGYPVRAATDADSDACNRLCEAVHGHDRAGELTDALAQDTARVVERHGRISGYTTGIGFFSHAVAETNDDLQALIADAAEFTGPGFLVPARNSALVGWCLRHGFRLRMVTTLMTIGLYNEPQGAYLPSILY
ncbi:MAG TPA: GNAT family N-acetyltransferase [Gaiellaceae bacterium]|nr:GNAT family N-acetyltransferase [Gaiellaceae bacterium]